MCLKRLKEPLNGPQVHSLRYKVIDRLISTQLSNVLLSVFVPLSVLIVKSSEFPLHSHSPTYLS